MKKYVLKDIVIAISILLLPIFLFLHEFVPQNKSLNLFFFTIDHGEYRNVNVVVWLINLKLFTIFLISLWYLTCKQWWKQALLVPLIIELFKLYGVFNPNYEDIDKAEFIYSLPFTLPIIILLVIISNRLNYFSITHDLKVEMDNEINDLFIELSLVDDRNIKNIIRDFKELKMNKQKFSNEVYLNKLKLLQDKLKDF